jgi:hypothetical protein
MSHDEDLYDVDMMCSPVYFSAVNTYMLSLAYRDDSNASLMHVFRNVLYMHTYTREASPLEMTPLSADRASRTRKN